MSAPPIVSLLTDYGRDDEFVGVCHGVILGIARDARIVDLSHEVPRHDVRRGAIVLRNALPYIPADVHVAVVDPQVGSRAARARGPLRGRDAARRARQRPAVARLGPLRRRRHRRRRDALAVPARAGVVDLPRP